MDLEWPYPGGVRHFRPPRCPHSDCSSRVAGGPPFRYRPRGRFLRACDGRTVRRFHCHSCLRSFSVQTFRVDYRLKRPRLTFPVFDGFVSKVTQRQMARTLVCTRKTVRRRLILLSSHARHYHAEVLERARVRGLLAGRFQLDEQETYEADRLLRPVTMPVLIHQKSRFVVHVEVAPLPARGQLRPRDHARKLRLEAREGVRRSGSRAAVKRCFEVLARALRRGAPAIISTDEKSSYATVLAETMPGRFVHRQTRGKLPKTVSNALWPINHTLAMLRDGPSRLVRETWAATKERAWLARHVWIWIAYRNYIRCFTNKEKDTTSALKAGLVRRTFSKASFFEWRVHSTS